MDAELIDWLTMQYVWSIQNRGDWHFKAQAAMKDGNFGKFRRVTGNFINKIEMMEGRRLQGIEWAFVVLELWTYLGGKPELSLTDPGTLRDEYTRLVHKDSAPEPSVPMKRRKGDLFCIYGDAYTLKPANVCRQGLLYTEKEIDALEKLYRASIPLEKIATVMYRTGLGICEKMCLMGLLYRDADGNFACNQDVPATQPENATCNPCGEILLEVATHAESAACHLDRVANNLETIMKEKSMTAIATNPTVAIETRTIIFGYDAAGMSDEQLIDAIKKVEGQIAALKEVKTSSKKIAGNIKELEKQLDAIVAVLDAR